MTAHAIDLDQLKGLFRNDEAFNDFLKAFRGARADMVPLFASTELIGTLLTAEAAKDYLQEQILKRLARDPNLLSEIAERLEHDDTVE